MNDFRLARPAIAAISGPSHLPEMVMETPNPIAWDDIVGLENVKRKLEDVALGPLDIYPKTYLNFRRPPRPAESVLLYGPRGCGKTLLAEAMARKYRVNLIGIKGRELRTMRFAEAAATVRDAFHTALASAPCVLLVDELDCIAKSRDDGDEQELLMLCLIMTEMERVMSSERNIVLIGATNRPEVVDTGILNGKRLRDLFYVPLPDEASRLQLLGALLRNKSTVPLARDVHLMSVLAKTAEATHGFSHTDLAEICQRARNLATREMIEKKITREEERFARGEDPSQEDDFDVEIRTDHLVKAIAVTRRSLHTAEDIRKFELFPSKYRPY